MTPAPRWARWLVWNVIAHIVDGASRTLFNIRVDGAEHLPRTGPVVVAPNHVSYLDPMVVFTVLHRLGRRPRFLGVAAVFGQPVVGWVIRAAGFIPVHRDRPGSSPLAAAAAALAAGDAVVLYPEGTIPAPGVVADAKPGAGRLAVEHGVPVVPLRHAGLERAARRGIRRPAHFRFGPAVLAGPDEDPEAVADDVLARIRALG